MRKLKHASSGDSNNGLAQIMKLVTAIVFSLTIALLNMTTPPQQATVHVSDTAAAVAPEPEQKTNTKPAADKPAKKSKPKFDADKPSTWPKCKAGEIVRADNGKCAKAAVAATPQPATKPKAAPKASGNVESIIRAAAAKYGLDGDYMVRLAVCESTLNPNAVNYGYNENGYPSGLYQHLSGYWPARAAKYGHAGASVFDAKANAEVTAGMIRDGGAGLWECKG